MTGIRARIFCSFFSFFIRPFAFLLIIVFRNRGVCVNEPFDHGLTLREEGQVELMGRRLTDFAQLRACRKYERCVNKK